jgi:fibronectin-binding autotransporter adhesin
LLGNNTYTGRTSVQYDTLVVGNPQALGSTNQGTELWPTAALVLNLTNGAQVTGESLLVADTTFTTNRPTLSVMGSVLNSWSGPVTNLAMPLKLNVPDANGTLNLNAAISGVGSLEKTGPGKLILAGSNANTYTGGTVVTNGTLRLNKPNGVQAAADLSVYFPSWLEWGANEQIADTATLRLIDCDTIFSNRIETITHLVMRDGYLDSGNGALTLLGDIEVPAYNWLFGPYNHLHGSLILGPGTHQIINPNPDPFLISPILDIYSATSETGGSAGLRISSGVRLRGSNSFTGPVIVDRAWVTIFHPQALGSPAQGTILTNSGALDLAMPSGSVVAGESLVLAPPAPDALYPSVLSMYGFETNTWAGPVTLQGSNTIRSTYGCKLTIDGTVSGPGTLYSDGNGELVLAGSQPNTIPGLIMDEGILRLAKPPGVVALTGDFILNTDNFDNVAPTLILEAPGQFPPPTTAYVGRGGTNAFLNLNGHAAAIKRLLGSGRVLTGTGTLTISNSAAQFSDYLGSIEGAPGGMNLIKQGIAQQRVGSFNLQGAMSVQGGTVLMDNGSIGALDISAGALMDMYAPVAHFGSLSGAGGISTAGNGLIYVGGNNLHTVFSGVIFGGSQTNLVKVGTGALTLTGANTDSGKTVIQNGTLVVNSTLRGPVHVQPGGPGQLPTLGGIGTLGNVIVTGAGARLAPGATTSVPSFGKLTVTNIALDGGALYLGEIGGTNAGVNLDQIDAKATTTLLNCGADFTAFGAGAVSNRYAVLKSFAAVNGTFLGKSEGSTFFPSAGRSMQITYVGGASGREIVLMDLAAIPPGSFSGIQVLTNGAVQVGGTGTPGVLYEVQANANLNTTNWILIGTATGNFNGAFSFIDTNAPVFPMRFYRFLLP